MKGLWERLRWARPSGGGLSKRAREKGFSRFERRILGAMAFAALATLLGALMLGRAALYDAYRVGVNGTVRARLEEGVASHRAHLEALRVEAETIADAIAFHHALPLTRATAPRQGEAAEPNDPFATSSPTDDELPDALGGFEEPLDEALGPLGSDPALDGGELDGARLDGAGLDGTALDGTALDGTALDGSELDDPADTRADED